MGGVGEKMPDTVGDIQSASIKLNEQAQLAEKRAENAETFLRELVRIYDTMRVGIRGHAVVLYPTITEITRTGLTLNLQRGDETIRNEMRRNYHFVIDVDKSSDEVVRLGVKRGDRVQCQDFPFVFNTPIPLSDVNPDFKGIDLYAIKAFDILAIADGLQF